MDHQTAALPGQVIEDWRKSLNVPCDIPLKWHKEKHPISWRLFPSDYRKMEIIDQQRGFYG